MRRLLISGVLAVLALGVTSSQAGSGQFDPTFGQGGKVTEKIGRASGASTLALTPDGHIVAAGWRANRYPFKAETKIRGLLARFKPNGSLDRRFGKNGFVRGSDASHALARQPDGKLLTLDGNSALVRRTQKGSLDSSFGTAGVVQTPFGFAEHMALQSDGKVVVVGIDPSAVVRYNSDGSLDSAFGVGGIVQSPTDTYPGRVVIQPDGKIVAGGWGYDSSFDYALVLIRYQRGGTLDTAFGSQGVAIPATSTTDGQSTRAIALQPDGKIVVLGEDDCLEECGGAACESSGFTVRLEANGSLDPGFTRSFESCHPSSLAIEPDGKLLVAGSTPSDNRNGEIVVAGDFHRLKSNGAVDKSFGDDGKVVAADLDPGYAPNQDLSSSYAPSLLAQPDGKLVAAGRGGSRHGKATFALVRLLRGTERCVVPDVRGKTLRKAKRKITAAYCSARAKKSFSQTVARGHVISQKPRPGARRHAGATVKLVVSKGRR